MEYTLITGASSGMGKQIALYLSSKRNLILNGRNIDRLKVVQDKCGKNSIVWPYDLNNVDDVESALGEFLFEQGIKVSSFIHCAGLSKVGPIRTIDIETINLIFSVNVYAPILITKTLASRKVNGRFLKSVVFISSSISNRGAKAFSIYGASKAALDGAMRNLAVELAPNTRVNSVLPGAMLTEMTRDIYEDQNMKEVVENHTPLGSGAPLDIVPIVEFLLSDKARWITGQQFTVDGGRTIDITERR